MIVGFMLGWFNNFLGSSKTLCWTFVERGKFLRARNVLNIPGLFRTVPGVKRFVAP